MPSSRTAKAITQAMTHWLRATKAAERPLFSSRLTAAMAATQGVYSKVKTRNTKAVKGLNIPARAWGSSAMEEPVSTARVLTTVSLAEKPVMRAVDTRQSPKPRGVNRGAMSPPSIASRLLAESVTMFRRESKLWRNQMMMVATKITVKARVRKSLALSHSSIQTLLALGSR